MKRYTKRYLKKHYLDTFKQFGFDVYINQHQMDDEIYMDVWDEIIDIIELYNCYCYGSTIVTERDKDESIKIFNIINKKLDEISIKYNICIKTSQLYDVCYFYSELIDNNINYVFAREYLNNRKIKIFENYYNCKGEDFLKNNKFYI